MFYTRLRVTCDPEFTEILIAEIGEAGFDTFMETDDGFEAFAEGEKFNAGLVAEVRKKYSSHTTLQFDFDRIEKKNWNEEWEKNYEPIDVEGKCLIRADFHKPKKSFPYEIIITPKMSFGTGHHQTTYLMIKNQMEIDHKDKRVMDAGCGTAILSVMASKLGAREVEAFDIDEWSVINGEENKELNSTSNIRIQQGKISDVKLEGPFDIILANINKNVLIDELRSYHQLLSAKGVILLSGFYSDDIPDLLKAAKPLGLREVRRDERERWSCLLLSA